MSEHVPKMRLRAMRKARGMTQEAVADAIGVSDGFYNMLENGKRRMNETHLASLAKLYGVPVSAMVEDAADDPDLAAFIDLFSALDPAQRVQAADYLRFLATRATIE